MMKASRTAAVVAALFAGAVFGSMSTGCFALWLGVAHASGATPAAGVVVDVSCAGAVKGSDGNMYAVAAFPGSAVEDIAANVSVAKPGGDPNSAQGTVTIGSTKYVNGVLTAPRGVADGSALVACAPGAASVQVYVRQ